MSRRVVITGIGAVTAIECYPGELMEDLCGGVDGITEIDSTKEKRFYSERYGLLDRSRLKKLEVEYLDKNEMQLSSCTRLSLITAAMAVQDAGISFDSDEDKRRTMISMASTQGDQYLFSENDEKLMHERFSTPVHIAEHYDIHGESFYNLNACSAGNYAVCYAYDRIMNGYADTAIVSSADVISEIICVGFTRLKALSRGKVRPFDINRDGTTLSEGAVTLIVEELEHAIARNAVIYGEIIGYGISNDAYNIVSPDPEGTGVRAAAEQALSFSGIAPEAIDMIALHGTGTRANDSAEAKALGEIFSGREKLPCGMAIKGALGHQLGAASAAALAVSLLVMRSGIIPGTMNTEKTIELPFVLPVGENAESRPEYVMNNAYAFGGSNSSVIIRRWDDEG